MIITKVKYEKLFPVGAYLNEKIGFEADLSTMTDIDTMSTTNEDPLAAIEKLRQLCEQSHKEKYPHLYTEFNSNDQRGTYVTPVANYSRCEEPLAGNPSMSQKDMEQKLILMAELETAKTPEEVTTIYNEAPAAVKSDQEFFEAVIKAKQRTK